MPNQTDTEPIYTYKIIESLLTNDAALKSLFGVKGVMLYSEVAPNDAPDFYLVVNMPSSDDVNFMDCNRGFSNVVNSITCVSKDIGLRRTSPIMRAVDMLMESYQASVVEGVVYVGRFQRTNVSPNAILVDNVRWFYLMSVYETLVYAMPQ